MCKRILSPLPREKGAKQGLTEDSPNTRPLKFVRPSNTCVRRRVKRVDLKLLPAMISLPGRPAGRPAGAGSAEHSLILVDVTDGKRCFFCQWEQKAKKDLQNLFKCLCIVDDASCLALDPPGPPSDRREPGLMEQEKKIRERCGHVTPGGREGKGLTCPKRQRKAVLTGNSPGGIRKPVSHAPQMQVGEE